MQEQPRPSDNAGLPLPPEVAPLRKDVEQPCRTRGIPMPQDLVQMVRRPPETWTPAEISRLFEWLVQEKLRGLVAFAYGTLAVHDPKVTLEDALEAVAEKLLDALRFLYTFDPTQASFLHWLYVMLRRHCNRAGAKSAARRGTEEPLEVEDKEGNVTLHDSPDPAAMDFDRWARARDVWQCLNRLPQPYRDALIMQHFEEMSYAAIARVMAITINNAKQRVFRAKLMLKACLEEERA